MIGELPASAFPVCMFCGALVTRPGSPLVLHEVTGFTRPRSAGGANHIIARKETGRVVCDRCALRVTADGYATEQEALFDA